MDTSFTFVTALTPAAGKIKGAPKFSKLSSEKLKESNPKSTNDVLNKCKPNSSKAFYKFTFDRNTSSSSRKTTNDSIPSLKSCSDSLHFSSDRSLSDYDEKSPASFDQSRRSDSQTNFKKIIQEVHAGLERITFRKKKTQKSVEKPAIDSFNNCLQQLTSIRIDATVKAKSNAVTDGCDKISNTKSSSTEELDKLRDKMLDLSIEKSKTTSTSKPKGKTINKKLFNSPLVAGDKSKRIQIVDDVVTVPSTTVKNTPFGSDSSGIISEDISPIARLSVAPLTNAYLDSDDLPTPTNFLDIDAKTSSPIQITDKIETKEISKKDSKPINKTTKLKDNKKKARKVLSEFNDFVARPPENEIKGKSKENSVRPKTKKTKKKKDSFIVSDTSSVENESMSVYHRFIAENIKFDVIKTTTPRSKYKNNPDFHDDGIFTPYIIGKRSSSDESFSENEEEPEQKNRIKKTRLSNDDDDSFSNIRKSLLSSLSSLSDNEKNKGALSDLEALPKENEKKPKEIQPKKAKPKKIIRLNISDSSKSSPDSSKNDVRIDLTSSPSFTPGSSSTKKKITPITFKLKNLKKLTPARTPKTNKEPLSFLRSLSSLTSPNSVHPDAALYRKSFKKNKEELARKLFTLFNKEVFQNKLPDDLNIEWNPRLRTTSGLCYNRRVKTVITANNECQRVSRIALSTKIIETPERLRDTLIHELCHAATWIIDNKADGHGPCWKVWANRAMRRFPELPPIKRCHDYSIQTKFKYRCVSCGYTIGRHSKSLNLERKRCGYCYGRFELLLNHENVKGGGASNNSPKNVKAKPLSKFALFVKDNYGKIKNENANMKHGDIMRMLSKNFAETKI